MKKRRPYSPPPSRSGPLDAQRKLIPGPPGNGSKSTRSSLFTRWSARFENFSPIWRFGLKFGGLMGLFYILILTPIFDQWLYAYLGANARVANGILNLMGQDTHVSEITIRAARYAITVRRGCDAIEPSWFFCAALLAFPARLGRKVLGILMGAILLQILNLVRIVSLFYVGLYHPIFFDAAHVEIWPAVFIVVTISFWIGWISWMGRSVPTASHAAA